MHSEQNVWPQEVIIGVFMNSLHTWQRIGDSTATKPERVVEAQSVASGTSKEFILGSIVDVVSVYCADAAQLGRGRGRKAERRDFCRCVACRR